MAINRILLTLTLGKSITKFLLLAGVLMMLLTRHIGSCAILGELSGLTMATPSTV